MSQKVALVLGASGLVGSNLVKHLVELGTWRVLGASRAKAVAGPAYEHIPLDLMNADQCREVLRRYPDVTHVFIAARLKDAGFETMEKNNVALTRNLLDAVEAAAPNLKHVHLVQGNKWYGSSSGPTHSDIPAREDDPRQMPPNPYYSQHDYLVQRQAGKSWSWSAIRPGAILGFAPAYPNNLVTLVGAYAAISRELNLPLRFPGTETCFNLALVGVDVEILCKAIVWISEHDNCRNQAFNVTNGDTYSWANLWPRVAKSFGMEVGYGQPIVPFSTFMKETNHVWDAIVAKHGLKNVPIGHVVGWEYGDYHFFKTRGDLPSVIKLWKSGFHEFTDTGNHFLNVLEQYRAAGLLPR